MKHKPLIAVVDDDPAVLQALSRLIRSRGGAALSFTSGVDFLGCLSTTSPDFLVLDVQMPGMTGLELYSKLLALGRTLPVAFITAHEDKEAEKRARESGAVAFLYKPFHSDVLWAAIHSALASPPSKSH